MYRKISDELLSFIQNNPTAFHVIASVKAILRERGYEELLEGDTWNLQDKHSYYVCRNDSSLIAFQISSGCGGFNIVASHTDSPAFKLKEKAELRVGEHYTKLNTEGYGGMLCSAWLDRPLSVAGRVLIRRDGGIATELVDLAEPVALIPSVAIHMNRTANDGYKYNKQVDLLPLFAGAEDGKLMDLIADKLNVSPEQILGSDLYLYPKDQPAVWGRNREFISSGRLDNQQCVYGVLQGFVESRNEDSINVMACFDSEEVGSATRQGAASTFLTDVLRRICLALGKSEEDYLRALASSFMLSTDNAHAVHPNHPELTDAENCVYMNEGVVVKSHAGQRYTSDGISVAALRELACRAGVPLQFFSNRSDMAGGSTLGNIALRHVSVKCADIGLPQLAMHSAYETAGVRDTQYLIRLIHTFYNSTFTEPAPGTVEITTSNL